MGETYARFRTCRTACCGDDRFTHDYDEILYHDSTRNMTENVSELQMMIQQGDTEHLSAWLNEVISEETVPQEYNGQRSCLKNWQSISLLQEQEQSVEKVSLKLRLAEKKQSCYVTM